MSGTAHGLRYFFLPKRESEWTVNGDNFPPRARHRPQSVATPRIVSDTAVSEDEIRRLGKRFVKLDKDGNGKLSIDEFMA